MEDIFMVLHNSKGAMEGDKEEYQKIQYVQLLVV